MSQSAEIVRRAVLALHRGDPEQQSQANRWLTEFQATPEAWYTAHSLINSNEAQEVQFFAASLLVRKMRLEWHQIDPSMQHQLSQALTAKFQDVISWTNQSSLLVVRQLCILQAAVLVTSTQHSELTHAITNALGLLEVNPIVFIELLGAIAEVTDDLHSRKRISVVTTLLSSAKQVLSSLAAVLTRALHLPQQQHIALQTLKTTLAWVKLSPHATNTATNAGDDGDGGQLDPAAFLTHHRPLFLSVASALSLSTASGDIVAAATDVFVAVLNSNNFGPEDDHDAPALNALIAAILSISESRMTHDEQIALTIAQLGSAIAERWPEGTAGILEDSIRLKDLLLRCVGHTECMVAEAALDFFFMVNTVPLSHRKPEFRGPLFQQLIQSSLHHVTYPRDFPASGKWEDDLVNGIDSSVFYRLRDAVFPEALQESYGLLRVDYLLFAADMLQKASTWQQAEVAMYLTGAVALAARTRALMILNNTNGINEAIYEDSLKTKEVLKSIFWNICGENGHYVHSHPCLAGTACWLMEQYAVWLGKIGHDDDNEPKILIKESLRRILDLLPIAPSPAAKAYHALCLRCSPRLQNLILISALLESVHRALSSGILEIEEEKLLVEGMAHVAAGLQPSGNAEAAATHLTRPIVELLQTSIPLGLPASNVINRCLQLIASVLKSFLAAALASGQTSSTSGGPSVMVLQSMGNSLNALACSSQWRQDHELMLSLIEVYKQAVCSARRRSVELLPVIMPAVGIVFAATALPSCLEVISEAVEIHFQDSSIVNQLMDALTSVCNASLPVLNEPGANLQEKVGLVAALLGLADSFAVYAPAALWSSPTLPSLLSLATAVVGSVREIEPVSKALSLFGHILSVQERLVGDPGPGVAQIHIESVYTVLLNQGQSIVEALLRGLCDTCPRQSLRSLADRLRTLLIHPALQHVGSEWLRTAVMSGQLPGVADGVLTEGVCSKFCTLVIGGTLRAGRLTSLLVDFGLVARREETPDVLLAYEL